VTSEEIALLEGLLARVKSANDTSAAISENRRGETDDGNRKEAVMCKVSKPYKNRNKWRVRVTDTESDATRNHIYDTEEEALAARPKLLREYRRPVGVPMPKALAAYQVHLQTKGNVLSRGPNKPRTVETTMHRLRSVFQTEIVTGELTTATMLRLWESWVQGKAVDTALNVLAQSRTFLSWLGKQGWTKESDVLVGIEVTGKRKKGKSKLTQDEAHQLLRWCLDHPDDPGAVATAMAFLLGMRASEIVTRTIRHLDGHGTLIEVTDAKTEAGERTLKLPQKLRPLLAKLAQPALGVPRRQEVLRGRRRSHRQPSRSARHSRKAGSRGWRQRRALGRSDGPRVRDDHDRALRGPNSSGKRCH
jgi:integrase